MDGLNLKYLIPNYYVSEMRRPIKANEVLADIKIIAELVLELGNTRITEGDWEEGDCAIKAKVGYFLGCDLYEGVYGGVCRS